MAIRIIDFAAGFQTDELPGTGVSADTIAVDPIPNLTATDLQAALEEHQADIDALYLGESSLSGAVATHTTQIGNLQSDVGNLQTRMTAAEGTLVTQASQISSKADATATASALAGKASNASVAAKLDSSNGVATSLQVANYFDITEVASPTTPSSGFLRVYAKADKKLYFKNSLGVESEVGSGSSSGAGGITYWDNGDFESAVAGSAVAGWTAYTGAGAVPSTSAVTTDSSPTTTFLGTASALRGNTSGLLTKATSNQQGKGYYRDFTIKAIDRSKPFILNFDYLTAAFATGDYKVYLWDLTNNALLPLTQSDLALGYGLFRANTFTTTSLTYRLMIHCAVTTTNAATITLDGGTFGPGQLTYGYSDASAPVAGMIEPFAGGTIPAGFALCDGQELSQTLYSELFARIGTVHNTQINPTTGAAWAAPSAGNFRVPDYRGIMLKGVGTPSGASAVSLGGFQSDQNKEHSHNFSSSTPTGTDLGATIVGSTSVQNGNNVGGYGTPYAQYGVAIKNSGGDEVRVRNRGVNWIIRLYDAKPLLLSNASGIEYASYPMTTDADQTNTYRGTDGSTVPTVTLTTGRYVEVTWLTPRQTGDFFQIEIDNNGDGRWTPHDSNPQGSLGYVQQNGIDYGVYLVHQPALNTSRVYFARYATNNGATYGASGRNWSSIADMRWRLRKVSAALVAGIQMASKDGPGLLSVEDNGSFVGTLAGATAAVTTTINYSRVGKVVTLSFGSNVSFTKNGTVGPCNINGFPASITPSSTVPGSPMPVNYNGTGVMSNTYIGSGGVIEFYRSPAVDTFAAGSVNAVIACTIVYRLP